MEGVGRFSSQGTLLTSFFKKGETVAGSQWICSKRNEVYNSIDRFISIIDNFPCCLSPKGPLPHKDLQDMVLLSYEDKLAKLSGV